MVAYMTYITESKPWISTLNMLELVVVRAVEDEYRRNGDGRAIAKEAVSAMREYLTLEDTRA